MQLAKIILGLVTGRSGLYTPSKWLAHHFLGGYDSTLTFYGVAR